MSRRGALGSFIILLTHHIFPGPASIVVALIYMGLHIVTLCLSIFLRRVSLNLVLQLLLDIAFFYPGLMSFGVSSNNCLVADSSYKQPSQ